jgi:hypothetical protein
MKFVPNAVSIKVSRQLLIARKNSPAIMFGAGIATGVLAAVKACQSTLKLEEVLAKHETTLAKMEAASVEHASQYSAKDYASDLRLARVHVTRDVSKLYAVPVCLGFVSIGLLTGAHVTLTRRNVALAAAYTILDRTFNEYRGRVRNELGDDKDREFRYGVKRKEIVEENEEGHVVKTVNRNGAEGRLSMYARPFDSLNVNFDHRDEYNRNFLWMQQCYLNNRLQKKGHLLLNDVYDHLGMERTEAGCVVGWVLGGNGKTTAGDGYIDFGCFDEAQQLIEFMRGDEGAIWLDFNVDGVVYKLIEHQ